MILCDGVSGFLCGGEFWVLCVDRLKGSVFACRLPVCLSVLVGLLSLVRLVLVCFCSCVFVVCLYSCFLVSFQSGLLCHCVRSMVASFICRRE